jgi:hypothetical protein
MAYFIGKYRIFTPKEILKLYMYAEKPVSKSEFLFFSLGFRYNEGQEILKHPEWFDPNTRIIHFQSNKTWDRELIYKDRYIFLSYNDVVNVHNYLVSNKTHIINPKYGNLTRNMNNWAKNDTSIFSSGIGVHCLRLTRFAWLLQTFPDYTNAILESMDYNPTKHYKIDMNDAKIEEFKNVPFTEHEKSHIKSLLFGWSAAPS